MNLNPNHLAREEEESEYGEVIMDVTLDEKRRARNMMSSDLVIEIPGRGNRDFAEWQRISWEEELVLESAPASGDRDMAMKATRGGMQPTRGRGKGRGRPRKESYRASGRPRGRPRLVRQP